jgi:hypothetical protein
MKNWLVLIFICLTLAIISYPAYGSRFDLFLGLELGSSSSSAGDSLLLEDGSGSLLLEDSGSLLLE